MTDADLNWVEQRFKRLEQAVFGNGNPGLLRQVTGLRADVEELRRDAERLSHKILGNGREGLVARVVRLEQSMRLVLWLWSALAVATFGPIIGRIVGSVV